MRRSIGEFIIEQIETRPRVVLTAKEPSATPAALDNENQLLCNRVAHVLWGVAAVAGIPMFNLARLFSGGSVDGETRIQRSATVEQFYKSVHRRPTIGARELRSAVRFAQRLDEMMRFKDENPRLFWRFVSGTNAFVTGLKASDHEERLHQFVRAIESFQQASGRGWRDFARCSSLFIAHAENDTVQKILEEMYDLRSAAEHHRHFAERALPGVEAPEEHARRRGRQADLARELFARFVAGEQDLLYLFRDDQTLESTWADAEKVRTAWGELLDLEEVK